MMEKECAEQASAPQRWPVPFGFGFEVVPRDDSKEIMGVAGCFIRQDKKKREEEARRG